MGRNVGHNRVCYVERCISACLAQRHSFAQRLLVASRGPQIIFLNPLANFLNLIFLQPIQSPRPHMGPESPLPGLIFFLSISLSIPPSLIPSSSPPLHPSLPPSLPFLPTLRYFKNSLRTLGNLWSCIFVPYLNYRQFYSRKNVER